MSDIRKKIGWADWSFNPVWGCLNDCPYCYAKGISRRFAVQLSYWWDIPEEKFKKFLPIWIEKNFQKKIPNYAKHVFVNSMSDIMFWREEWFEKVLEKADLYPEKKFLFLTKSTNIFQVDYDRQNVFIGRTITKNEDIALKDSIKDFYSIEPIHERINLNLIPKTLKQIIVGAETGNRKGKIIPSAEWIEEIREFCRDNEIKLYEKDSLKNIVKRELIQQKI